jgi:PPM family protein phosphatase
VTSLGRHTGMTDTGRKRRHNEDSFFVAPPLFAVADGMGGANAGEIASGLAVAALREGSGDDAGERLVVSLIQEANRRVYERQTDDAAASGMGTTMTVALIEDGIVRIGHVGDSRAYLYRDGELEQLTEDHSLVGELYRSGKITAEEAETHPQRSVITRALGTDPDVDVDTLAIDAQPGDVFLLCSDGLYSMVGTDNILDVLERRRNDLDAAAKELIRSANKRGGDDNITIVAFEIARTDERETEALEVAPATGDDVAPDEEDTIDESDRVPAVTTQVLSAEELASVTEGSARDTRGRARTLAVVLTIVAIVVAVAVALYLLEVV